MLWIIWYMWLIPLVPLCLLESLGEILEDHPNEAMRVIGKCLLQGSAELAYYIAVAREKLFIFFGGYISEKETVCNIIKR